MSRKDTSSIHFLEREFVKMLAPNRVIAEVYVSVFPAACVAPWGAGIVSSWAGIQHHLHNDNPVLEYLRRGGFWFWCINPWKPNSHPDWDLWAWLWLSCLCEFVQFSLFCMSNIVLYFYQHVSFLGPSPSKEGILKWMKNTHLRWIWCL